MIQRNLLVTIVIIASIGWTAALAIAIEKGSAPEVLRAETARTIRETLQVKSATPGDLRTLVKKVRQESPGNQLVQQVLEDADDAELPTVAIRAALEQAAEILSFQPVEEAPLPEGFPELTPVGEIRVNAYPAYRLAQTPIGSSDSAAFFRLFRHIQSRDIAMTAPVEMTYDDDLKPRESKMAFLYRSNRQGELGDAGSVSVVDVPAQTVLSIGWRGEADPVNVAAARQLLKSWLDEHANEYRVAGKMRVMGHNSPFVRGDKRYFEVQFPIAAKEHE